MDTEERFYITKDDIEGLEGVIELLQNESRDRESLTWQLSTKIEDIVGDLINNVL